MDTPKIAPSEVHARNPQVTFQTSLVAPPSPLYVDELDLLWCTPSFITASPLSLQITMRFLRADGQIISNTLLMQNLATGVGQSFPLTEGFILSLEVGTLGGTNLMIGGFFVTIGVLRGIPSSLTEFWRLTSGYVTTQQRLSWPGHPMRQSTEGPGKIRVVVGTTPGAGAEISETVPSTLRWRLKAMRFSLTTSATVVGRTVNIAFDDGANIFWQVFQNNAQAASITFRYLVGPGLITVSDGSNDFVFATPNDLPLVVNFRIRTITASLQVGDQFTAPVYEVEEWIES